MDKSFIAKQFNKAVSLMVQGLSVDDSVKMEIADIYPAWEENSTYTAGTVLKYKYNVDGETQLYEVLQNHTSQSDWPPDAAVSLYKKIGFTDSGIPIWTQPLGASDAYMKGDEVEHKGKVWISEADNNVWEPGVYGWKEKIL